MVFSRCYSILKKEETASLVCGDSRERRAGKAFLDDVVFLLTLKKSLGSFGKCWHREGVEKRGPSCTVGGNVN